jgi:predicted Zn-dependent peptidase
MESDRMADPVLREFYSERDVVYEERRLRTDNDPGGKLWEQLYAAAYVAHPYGWPVLGWPSDLETVLREEVEAFFHQYYAPNNVVIAIVGDVKYNDIERLVAWYFNPIPPSPKPPPQVETVEPGQQGERRIAVEYDAQPELAIGYHGPAGGGIDKEALDVLASLLSRGRTSRLYRSLVEQKELATYVDASSDFTRFPDLFIISAAPKAPHTSEEVESAIYEELEKLEKEGPSVWELQRVRNQLEADYARGMRSNLGMAFRLADMQALVGDWSYINTLREKREAVTADDVKRAMAKYLIKSNRTVAFLVKPEDKAEVQTTAPQELEEGRPK